MKKIVIFIAALCSMATLVGCVENGTYADSGYYSSGGHTVYPASSVTSGYNRDFQEKRIQQQTEQQADYHSSAQQSNDGGYSSSAAPKQYRTKKRNSNNGYYSSSNSEDNGYESSNGYSSSVS